MIDLIDLMNEPYYPNVDKLDTLFKEISFINSVGDHHVHTTITKEQMQILKENAYALYKKLNAYL